MSTKFLLKIMSFEFSADFTLNQVLRFKVCKELSWKEALHGPINGVYMDFRTGVAIKKVLTTCFQSLLLGPLPLVTGVPLASVLIRSGELCP